MTRIPDRLERDEHDPVSEVVRRLDRDRLREPRLSDSTGSGDGEYANVVTAQEGGRLGHAHIAPDEGGHRRRHRVSLP